MSVDITMVKRPTSYSSSQGSGTMGLCSPLSFSFYRLVEMGDQKNSDLN